MSGKNKHPNCEERSLFQFFISMWVFKEIVRMLEAFLVSLKGTKLVFLKNNRDKALGDIAS